MHESSIISYTLDVVSKAAAANGVTQIDEITLTIGKLRMALPEALQKTFTLLADEPPFTGARLIIEEPDIRIQCRLCGEESILDITDEGKCQFCGSRNVKLLSGNELRIRRFTGA